MARAAQIFDHDSPAAPTRALGMLLGASGVTLPSPQTLGSLAGTTTGDGNFSDVNGYGQIDYSGGYLYVADSSNNRIQRFAKTSGVWAYESKLTGITTLLGGGSLPSLISIDRSVTPHQIHVAAFDHYTASNWVSVWSVSDWPTLTTGNRLRQYGANASSDTAGRAHNAMGLTVDGTYAVVSGLSSPYRQITFNHVLNTVIAQETQANQYAQWATDGAGNWWSYAPASAAETGVWKNNPATFTGISARIDAANAGTTLRRNRLATGLASNPVYAEGRVYVRDYLGRVMGWNASTSAYVDEFLWGGGLAAGGVVTGLNSFTANSTPLSSKMGVVVDGDGMSWLVGWCANADNANAQNFIGLWPLSTATATWTKTDWSAGTNTLLGIAIDGVNLSAEKIKIRLRKNAGSWVTLVAGQFVGAAFTAAISALGTFTSGDTLTVEYSSSTWDRLDGHATLSAVRDKLSPTNVYAELQYSDSVADVYVPYASTGFKGKAGGTGAYKGKIGG